MGKYDQYVFNPPHLKLSMKSDGTVFFDGLMAGHKFLGVDFTFGLQIVSKPFVGDNPCHTHDFQEFMAWYGTNPDDPYDFQAEVEFYFGEELEKHVFTKPTLVSLPPNLPHHPFEIKRIDAPIIQVEIMIAHKDVPVYPVFDKDKDYHPLTHVNREYL